LDGSQNLRVVTHKLPITKDRDAVEHIAKADAISLRALHTSAGLAQKGDYQAARVELISYQRLLQRGMKNLAQQRAYIQFIKQSERLDGFMREAQQQDDVFGSTGNKNAIETTVPAKTLYK